jgi:hypothetical protein
LDDEVELELHPQRSTTASKPNKLKHTRALMRNVLPRFVS